MNFFYLIFPCAKIFLVLRPPPPPHPPTPICFLMVRLLSIVFNSVDSVVPGGEGGGRGREKRTLRIMAYGYAPPIGTLRGQSVLTGLNLQKM